MVMRLKISQVFKIGPKKVSRIGSDQACIYLPKELLWLRGKKVFVTIEVLEEDEQ